MKLHSLNNIFGPRNLAGLFVSTRHVSFKLALLEESERMALLEEERLAVDNSDSQIQRARIAMYQQQKVSASIGSAPNLPFAVSAVPESS